MNDTGTLATIASIISGFGVAMLFFRIQRELQMAGENEINWIPWADRLLIGATLISLLLVILPLVALPGTSLVVLSTLPRAACAAAPLMVGGYIIAILAHYRLLFGGTRQGPRVNPEPAERLVVWMSLILAVTVFLAIYAREIS